MCMHLSWLIPHMDTCIKLIFYFIRIISQGLSHKDYLIRNKNYHYSPKDYLIYHVINYFSNWLHLIHDEFVES